MYDPISGVYLAPTAALLQAASWATLEADPTNTMLAWAFLIMPNTLHGIYPEPTERVVTTWRRPVPFSRIKSIALVEPELDQAHNTLLVYTPLRLR